MKLPGLHYGSPTTYSAIFLPTRISDKPISLTDSIITRYFVAILSSWTAEVVTYPFDLTKTRLQIQTEIASGNKLEKLGMVQTAVNIAKREGITKLWAGLSAMLQRQAVYSGCRLIIYEKIRDAFKDSNGKMSFGRSIFCGFTAGGLAQLIASPTDLVKVLMQAEGRRVLMGKPRRFNSSKEVYLKVYRERGILGFWRGAVPNVQRAALINVGNLAMYDYAKHFLMREFHMSDTILTHGISAYVAGLTAAILSTPADVMKTRLMNQPVGPDGTGKIYRNTFDCFQKTVKNEGFFALYKGFLPSYVRLGPWAMIYWVMFDNIMLIIGGKTF